MSEISRKNFIRLSVLSAAGAVLAACGYKPQQGQAPKSSEELPLPPKGSKKLPPGDLKPTTVPTPSGEKLIPAMEAIPLPSGSKQLKDSDVFQYSTTEGEPGYGNRFTVMYQENPDWAKQGYTNPFMVGVDQAVAQKIADRIGQTFETSRSLVNITWGTKYSPACSLGEVQIPLPLHEKAAQVWREKYSTQDPSVFNSKDGLTKFLSEVTDTINRETVIGLQANYCDRSGNLAPTEGTPLSDLTGLKPFALGFTGGFGADIWNLMVKIDHSLRAKPTA